MGIAAFVFFLLLAIGGAFALWAWLKTARLKKLGAAARRLGFRFYPNDPYGLTFRYGDKFPVLQEGCTGDRKAYNVVAGRIKGCDVFVFDHWHQMDVRTDYGTHKTKVHRSFVIAECDMDMGDLQIRSRRLFDKVGQLFGANEVKVNHPEFAKRYRVTSDFPQLAHHLLDRRVIGYLLKVRGFAMTACGTSMLIPHGSGRISPASVEDTVRRTAGFIASLPRQRAARGPRQAHAARQR